jgi:hypothetical protein
MTRPKKPSIEPKETQAETFTHPLLPGDGDKPPPHVRRFYVTRKNEKNGAWEFAPQAYGATDLPGPDALFATYGGGLYWIRGMDDAGWCAPFGVWPLAGAPKPLAPSPEPEAAPPAAVPSMPINASGGLDMGAILLMFIQGQQAQQAENTKLMGTIITAVLAPRNAPNPGGELSTRLLEALVSKGSPGESAEMMKQLQGAWKEGLGTGTQVAQVAAEAAAAGNVPAEPSALDKAMDSMAPSILGKMVEKVMG